MGSAHRAGWFRGEFYMPLPLAAQTVQPPWGRRKTSQPRSARGNAFLLWWLAPPPCPVGSVSLDSQSPTAPCESSSLATPTSWGHYKAPLCCELLMKGLLFRALFCPRLRGKSGEAGKGEVSAASQSAELFFMPYDIESQSRNADFISIARRAIHHPQRRRRCRPLSEAIHNPPPTGGHNLRPGGPSTFPFTTLLHNPRRQPRPFFIKLAAKPPPQSSA